MAHIKKRKHNLLASGATVGTALATSLMASAPAWAQENTQLPDITVQADQQPNNVGSYKKDMRGGSKFTDPISRTPKDIQIISKDIIEDQGATNLTDALKNSPGVGTFSLGEHGSSATGDAIYMRGFDTQSSILKDGVRDMGDYSRDTFNTEQIEVLKGPDGSAYGRTSPGGSINMVTKKAHLGNDNEVGLTFGDRGEKRATGDTNFQLDDTTAVRLNLMGENTGVAGRDRVRNRSWGIAPSISFGLGTDQTVKLNYLHLDQYNIPDGGVPAVGYPDAPNGWDTKPKVDSENFYGNSNDDFERVTVDSLTLNYKNILSPNLVFHNTARVGQTRQRYLRTAPGLKYTAPSGIEAHLQGKDQRNTIVTNQAGLVQDLDTGSVHHTLSYGLELTYEKVNRRGVDTTDPANLDPYNPQNPGGYSLNYTGDNQHNHAETYAAYLFDTAKFGDDFQVNAGARLDRFESSFDKSGSKPFDKDNNYTKLSWQLGSLYQLNDYGNVYIDYAVAYEPAGADGLYVKNSPYHRNNPDYEPQKAKTAELGTKWSLINDQLLLTAAVFQTDIENQLEKDPVTGDYDTVGKKRIKGLELTAVGNITPNWNVSLGYTHLHGEVKEGGDDSATGHGLSQVPSDAISGWTTYRLPFGLTLGGGVRYIGSIDRDDASGPIKRVKSYWVADAMAKYDVTDQLKLQLNIDNITNKDYVNAVNRIGQRYSPGQPRTTTLSLKYQF